MTPAEVLLRTTNGKPGSRHGSRRRRRWVSLGRHSRARYAAEPAGPGPDFQPDSGWIFGPRPRPFTQAIHKDFCPAAASYLVGQFAFGDLSLAENTRSIELFAGQVMPALA